MLFLARSFLFLHYIVSDSITKQIDPHIICQYLLFGAITVTNCKFFGAEGSALQYWGSPAKIYNNMFSWNDWSGQMGLVANGGFGTVYSSPTSKDEEFVGNTLWYNGASAGFRSGKTPIVCRYVFKTSVEYVGIWRH